MVTRVVPELGEGSFVGIGYGRLDRNVHSIAQYLILLRLVLLTADPVPTSSFVTPLSKR